MPRIRTIKPEFWADEKVGPLEPIVRLVFLGLVSMADDRGRLVDSVKQIDAFVFPYTDDSAGAALDVLHGLGRVQRGETAAGQSVLQITHWERHQKVDNPSKYSLPAIEVLHESRETLARPSRDTIVTTLTLDPDLRPVPTTADRCEKNGELSATLERLDPSCHDAVRRTAALAKQPAAWLAYLRGLPDGLGVKTVPPPDVLARALIDFAANGAAPSARYFRGFLARAAQPDSTPPDAVEVAGGTFRPQGKREQQTAAAITRFLTPSPPNGH